MTSKNICKFPPQSVSESLSVSCFVRESSTINMQIPCTLTHHRILLIANGQGVLKINQTDIPLRSGMLIFAFEHEHIWTKNEQDLTYMYIDFKGLRAEELLRRFDIKKNNRIFDSFDGLIPLWSESLSRASEQTIDLAAESILLYTFSRLFGNLANRNPLIDQIIEISEERFSDSTLSITTIADELSYNTKYLSHIFKEKMQMTYSEYLRSLRIKYAISLLDHGLDSIKNVAILSGFSDPLYFSNVFKKSVGVSPKAYITEIMKKRSN